MSTLTGTPKQVEWAERIVAELIATIDEYPAKLAAWEADETAEYLTRPRLALPGSPKTSQVPAYRAWLLSLTDAAWIIDNLGRRPQLFRVGQALRAAGVL